MTVTAGAISQSRKDRSRLTFKLDVPAWFPSKDGDLSVMALIHESTEHRTSGRAVAVWNCVVRMMNINRVTLNVIRLQTNGNLTSRHEKRSRIFILASSPTLDQKGALWGWVAKIAVHTHPTFVNTVKWGSKGRLGITRTWNRWEVGSERLLMVNGTSGVM